MLQSQSLSVRNIAKRMSRITKTGVILNRMISILRDSSRSKDHRIGYYVPNIGFAFSSVVPGEPSCIVELTPAVHSYMMTMMEQVDGFQEFTLIREYTRGRIMGTMQLQKGEHTEGQMVSINTLKIDCRPIDVVHVQRI